MRHGFAAIAILAIAAPALAGSLASKIAEFDNFYSGLEARYPRELSHKEFSTKLLAEYRESLKPECTPSHLTDLQDDGLRELFHVVQAVTFYSETEPEARDLALVFSEATRRNIDVLKDSSPHASATASAAAFQSSMVKYLYDAYMSSRLFEDARLLAEKYPTANLPPPPSVSVSSCVGKTSRAYDVDGDGRSMTIRSIEWNAGQKVVVVFSPTCGFSQQAFDDIEADGSLLPLFRAHAVLIAPTSDVLEAKSYTDWNKKRPAFKGHIAYKTSDWPELDLSSTPQFYFFRDGKLAFYHGGWRRPAADRKAELVKGLQAIGLATAHVSNEASILSEIAYFDKLTAELQSRYPENLSYRELSARLQTAYGKLLKPMCVPSYWRELGDEGLKTFFRALEVVAFHSQAEAEARDLGLLFSEAERRKIDVVSDLEPLERKGKAALAYKSSMAEKQYKAYVRAGMFEDARLLAKNYPAAGLPSPPSVIVSTDAGVTNRVYEVAGDGNSMILRSVGWKEGQKVVVVFSPSCHFSQRAIADIEGDLSLQAQFKTHSILISAPGEVLAAKSYSAWNREHPSFKGYIAHMMADWPELDLARTPQFYFYRDGRLMSHYDGWKIPTADRKAELINGLESIGLAASTLDK